MRPHIILDDIPMGQLAGLLAQEVGHHGQSLPELFKTGNGQPLGFFASDNGQRAREIKIQPRNFPCFTSTDCDKNWLNLNFIDIKNLANGFPDHLVFNPALKDIIRHLPEYGPLQFFNKLSGNLYWP
jgi:hypothetical protein